MLDESHLAANGCSAESFCDTTSLALGSPDTALSIDSLVACNYIPEFFCHLQLTSE